MDNKAPLSQVDVRRRPTVMLAQLLRDFDAPRVIDYLCAQAQSHAPAVPRQSQHPEGFIYPWFKIGWEVGSLVG
jgi:hypothetical protein